MAAKVTGLRRIAVRRRTNGTTGAIAAALLLSLALSACGGGTPPAAPTSAPAAAPKPAQAGPTAAAAPAKPADANPTAAAAPAKPAGANPTAAAAAAPQKAPAATPNVKPQKWQMGTAPTGGTYYTLGAAISKIVNSKVPGLQITAQVTPGSSVENLELLMARESELGMSSAENLIDAMKSNKPWKTLRMAFSEHASVMHFIVRKDSGINSPCDYKGKRVAVGNPSSGMNNNNANVLSGACGIAFKDMDTKQIHVDPGLQGIKDGNVDAVNIPTGVPVASVIETARTAPVKLLSLTPDQIKRLQQEFPFYSPITIPKGIYPGQDEDVHTVGAVTYMVTHDQVDSEAVYWMTRSVFENLADLRASHPVGAEFSAEESVRRLDPMIKVGYEYQPGAARYFKEIGLLP
ncbi:MAG: TAXI family TRAP transporter solute-binding subunit [Chloroflexi bacterium]|nr:TAXI family TRAP transporter solute-binding subunit [Chloroflexota bacterium]